MQMKGLRRNDDPCSTKSWYLKDIENQHNKNVFISRMIPRKTTAGNLKIKFRHLLRKKQVQ